MMGWTNLPLRRTVKRLPKDILWKERMNPFWSGNASESADLLHLRTTVFVDFLAGTLGEHLFLRVDIHGNFQKGLIEERYTSFQAPGHR